MAAAGVIGTVDPSLASSLFEYDALTHLGSAVIIGGSGSDGDQACPVTSCQRPTTRRDRKPKNQNTRMLSADVSRTAPYICSVWMRERYLSMSWPRKTV